MTSSIFEDFLESDNTTMKKEAFLKYFEARSVVVSPPEVHAYSSQVRGTVKSSAHLVDKVRQPGRPCVTCCCRLCWNALSEMGTDREVY